MKIHSLKCLSFVVAGLSIAAGMPANAQMATVSMGFGVEVFSGGFTVPDSFVTFDDYPTILTYGPFPSPSATANLSRSVGFYDIVGEGYTSRVLDFQLDTFASAYEVDTVAIARIFKRDEGDVLLASITSSKDVLVGMFYNHSIEDSYTLYDFTRNSAGLAELTAQLYLTFTGSDGESSGCGISHSWGNPKIGFSRPTIFDGCSVNGYNGTAEFWMRNLRVQSYAYNFIPEPATWAMLIAGFGMVGLAARRRRILAA